jgi:hypothetical protein
MKAWYTEGKKVIALKNFRGSITINKIYTIDRDLGGDNEFRILDDMGGPSWFHITDEGAWFRRILDDNPFYKRRNLP